MPPDVVDLLPICRILPDLFPLDATNSHAEFGDRTHGRVLHPSHLGRPYCGTHCGWCVGDLHGTSLCDRYQRQQPGFRAIFLGWKRELEYQAAFPQNTQLILVVVDVDLRRNRPARPHAHWPRVWGTSLLFSAPSKKKGAARSFSQNRLLFVPADQVARTTGQLANAEPIIGVLAKDPRA